MRGSRRRPSYGATLSIFPAKRKALGWALPTCVYIPRRLAEELERRGIDVESYAVDLLVRSLGLDPEVGSEAHLELALKYLEEGRALVDRDPVRASEKLYKTAEEVVRALAIHFNLGDILRGVSEGVGGLLATSRRLPSGSPIGWVSGLGIRGTPPGHYTYGVSMRLS